MIIYTIAGERQEGKRRRRGEEISVTAGENKEEKRGEQEKPLYITGMREAFKSCDAGFINEWNVSSHL